MAEFAKFFKTHVVIYINLLNLVVTPSKDLYYHEIIASQFLNMYDVAVSPHGEVLSYNILVVASYVIENESFNFLQLHLKE